MRKILAASLILLSLVAPVLAGWTGYTSLGVDADRIGRLSSPTLAMVFNGPAVVAYGRRNSSRRGPPAAGMHGLLLPG